MSILRQKAFTIIELLVVITVMGILAGVAIVGYGAWNESIAAKTLQSDLKGAKTAMNSARNFGSGYPTTPSFTGSSPLLKPSENVTITYVSGTDKTFCVNARSILHPSIVYHMRESYADPKAGACS